MDTLFTKIIKGEIPSYKVAEDDKNYAFLDINPIVKGHTLVIPKLAEPEADYIFDLTDEQLQSLMVFAKKVALAIQENIPCQRIGVAVIGLEVPHAHIHLVPISKEGDLNFTNARCKLSEEEFRQIAAQIAASVKL